MVTSPDELRAHTSTVSSARVPLDELFDVLRFELGEVDRDPGLDQLRVDLGERLRRPA